MCRGPYQDDEPALHMWEEGILLGLVEPMYFIHKEDRGFARDGLDPLGLLNDLSELLHPRGHCGKRIE